MLTFLITRTPKSSHIKESKPQASESIAKKVEETKKEEEKPVKTEEEIKAEEEAEKLRLEEEKIRQEEEAKVVTFVYLGWETINLSKTIILK